MTARRLVVQADGASRGNPGKASYGALVVDAASGELLAERAAAIGTATNNVAEYQGLVSGLEAAHEIDPGAQVEVRMDSRLVVEQMSGRWQIKHPQMRTLAAAARDAFPAGQVRYVWVPRERNKHADRLANEALDMAARGQRWTSRTPGPGASAAADRAPRDPGRPVASADVSQPELTGWNDAGRAR
jgi:ribonuclease H / adenosylcobalamin/alpha-ribazole phosphatase